jgi:ELWxxDGT repeat protein
MVYFKQYSSPKVAVTFVAIITLLISSFAYADTVSYLVKDIRSGSKSSFIEELINANGTLFFIAEDGTHGLELWKSDGTEAGTVMVKDIYPGSSDSFFPPIYREFSNINGTLFFGASDNVHGRELWKSDGTEDGTVIVKDIYPGPVGSGPTQLVNLNGTLFFWASDGEQGYELWKSDGTENGTIMAVDIIPGSEGLHPSHVTIENGTLFFAAYDEKHGLELWKSDTTETGTGMVKDIFPGSESSSIRFLTNVNGTLFFSAVT